MSKFNFSDQYIQGLIDGHKKILNDVFLQVRQVVGKEFQRRKLSEDAYEEIISSIVMYAVSSVQEGFCMTGVELERRLTRAVKDMARSYEGKTDRKPSFLKRGEEMFGSPEHERGKLEVREYRSFEKWLDIEREIERKYEAHLIYRENKTQEVVKQSEQDFLIVDDELIRFFKNHPQRMYELDPRRFEELVAAILQDLGYNVELTAQSADGGIDIIATQKTGIGEVLLMSIASATLLQDTLGLKSSDRCTASASSDERP
jgi:Restriction endonuclease